MKHAMRQRTKESKMQGPSNSNIVPKEGRASAAYGGHQLFRGNVTHANAQPRQAIHLRIESNEIWVNKQRGSIGE